MIGDEFKIREPRYIRPVVYGTGSEKVTFTFGNDLYVKPWYARIRTYVYAAVVFAAFHAGAYYNAWRQVDSVLPDDVSVVRDLGYVAPAEYRLEVGML